MMYTKAEKGKAPAASDPQELKREEISLAQLLDESYIQESPGRRLALNVKSIENPQENLLLRIIRNQPKSIDVKDLSAFEKAMENQREKNNPSYAKRQQENHVIEAAYQYFFQILNKSLSEENLFKLICLFIAAECKNCIQENELFRNDDSFVKRYLKDVFSSEKGKPFSQMSNNAQKYLHFILDQRKSQLSSKLNKINYLKDFFTLINFNFSILLAGYEPREAEQRKIYKAIEDFKKNEKKSISCSFFSCFKNPDIDQSNENPGLAMLEAFYTDYLTKSEQSLKDQQALLIFLISEFPKLQNKEQLNKMAECLVEYKGHPSNPKFKEALNNIYEEIKSNKLLGLGKTSEVTKKLFEDLNEAQDNKVCLALIEAYRKNPENEKRDCKKLLDVIYVETRNTSQEADFGSSISPNHF